MTNRQVRSRGLPEDHVGPVRVITIKGVDSNMCCGTHVQNLSHLQVFQMKKSPSMLISLTLHISLVGKIASHRERKEE